MRHYAARTLSAALLLLLLGYFGTTLLGSPRAPEPLRWTGEDRTAAEHTVFCAGKMPEDQILQFTVALAAVGHPGAVLFDSPATAKFSRAFIDAGHMQRLIAVGGLRADRNGVADTAEMVAADQYADVAGLQKALFSRAARVVVAATGQRRLLLHASCMAGVLKAPLLITDGQKGKVEEIKQQLADWNTQEVHVVGDAAKLLGKLGNIRLVQLEDEEAVSAATIKHLLKQGPIQTLVVANPSDGKDGGNKMSTLAPWIALQKRAALVLTNDTGKDAEDVIKAALRKDALAKADVLVIAADLKAIPMRTRPNPIEGGRDTEIEMEPMTPVGDQPCSFSVGRLFHDDRNVVALMLARQRLLDQGAAPKALIVSNPGGGLPLLETFSRHTANEFQNAGFDTTAYFGRGVNKADVKRKLPDANVFLWEGHYSTLVSTYGIHQWQEPLQPSLIFLQSCLALAEPKAQPFLERGAIGVIGSSTRTYSGSGGAFALAFFDTLLYEDQSLGGSLRQAKNFMLAFAELKKRRFGEESKLGGANVRTAWAFTLWGDPTARLPRPKPPQSALTAVQHAVKGNTIILTLPSEVHETITSAQYQAVVPANARLAGLVRKEQMPDQHKLVPFTFAEVDLPKAKAGATPRIRTKLPPTHWVFLYDERCQRGYLLVTPRARDQGELRFQLVWE